MLSSHLVYVLMTRSQGTLLTLNVRVPSYLGQYHGFWCPGSLRRQDISSHDIDYIEYVGPSLTWGRILSTCVISMWMNDIMFTLKNLACKGLMHNVPHWTCATWSNMSHSIFCSANYMVTFTGTTLIVRFLGPTWGPPGANRTQVVPMLATWTLLSGYIYNSPIPQWFSPWWWAA